MGDRDAMPLYEIDEVTAVINKGIGLLINQRGAAVYPGIDVLPCSGSPNDHLTGIYESPVIVTTDIIASPDVTFTTLASTGSKGGHVTEAR